METNSWFVIRTAPGAERIVMRRLHEAGLRVVCPAQVVLTNWHEKTCEVIAPLMAGCLFVSCISCKSDEGDSFQKLDFSFVVDDAGKKLVFEGGVLDVITAFVQLLRFRE